MKKRKLTDPNSDRKRIQNSNRKQLRTEVWLTGRSTAGCTSSTLCVDWLTASCTKPQSIFWSVNWSSSAATSSGWSATMTLFSTCACLVHGRWPPNSSNKILHSLPTILHLGEDFLNLSWTQHSTMSTQTGCTNVVIYVPLLEGSNHP